ncbi:hypothetical protein ABID97_002766 [Variovorax sp. OAS795]|uniref:hypothetical protein n=1 Tax=Variovorax sp. OAS795 TaxID=3034231 RepID=UPI0033938A66
MKRFALLAAMVGLAGSLAACGMFPVQTVMVPIPVACNVDVPARPAMPTEALSPGVDLDRFSASALAEIELREGYEGELRAAIAECIKPMRVE